MSANREVRAWKLWLEDASHDDRKKVHKWEQLPVAVQQDYLKLATNGDARR